MKNIDKHTYFIKQLEDIAAERLANIDFKPPEKQSSEFKIFSHKDFKIQFKDKEDLLKSLGRQAKNRLQKLAGFVEFYGTITRNYTKSKKIAADKDICVKDEVQFDVFDLDNINQQSTNQHTDPYSSYVIKVDFEERPTQLFISHSNGPLLKIYRKTAIILNVMKYARECGLIQCISGSYSNGSHNFSKIYAWNKVCEHQLRELFRDFHIIIPNVKLDRTSEVDFDSFQADDAELYYKIRLGSGMMTPNMTHDKAVSILSRKYEPILKPIYERNAFYNEGRPVEQQLKLELNTHISPKGFNTKNGCRSTASCSSFKKTRTLDDEYTGIYFDEYFRDSFGEDFIEIDVKGSVPRITRLVNYGIWDDEDLDPYESMFKGVLRKLAKSIYMPFQFEHTGMSFVNHVSLKTPSYVNKNGKDEVRQTLEYWTESVFRYQGESLGNLVFLCEDGIYSKVDTVLKKRGFKFIRKYDAWYFPESKSLSRQELNEIIRECAVEWRSEEWSIQHDILKALDNMKIKELKALLNENHHNLTTYTTTHLYSSYVIKVGSEGRKLSFRNVKHDKQMQFLPDFVLENSDLEEVWTLDVKIHKEKPRIQENEKIKEKEAYIIDKSGINMLLKYSRQGKIHHKDLLKYLDHLKITSLKALKCEQGFSASRSSIYFHNFLLKEKII